MNAKQFFTRLALSIPILLFLILTLMLIHASSAVTTTAGSDEVNGSATKSHYVTMSAPSGFYDAPFLLSLSAPDNFTIYYTLDGSLPDSTAAIYTAPISIQSHEDSEPAACVVRAIAIDTDHVSTDVASASYFIDYASPLYTSSLYAGSVKKDTKVLSIVTDSDNFYDSAIGIYVLGDAYDAYVAEGGDPGNTAFANYNQTGSAWERPVHIDFLDEENGLLLSQEAGIRINGNSSRESPQKSLRLYARKKYDGNNRFLFPLFEDHVYSKSFILRSGNFANQFLPSLVYDRNFSTQNYDTCAVFLNGAYLGDYYLLERYDTVYYENYYDVDSDNVTILKDGTLFSGSSKVYENYLDLLDFVENEDLSSLGNYEYLCSQMDIASFIDYYSTQIYLNNYDFSLLKNIVLWRSNETDEANPYADNRWRFSLMDLDYTLTSFDENYTTNSFSDRSVHSVVVQTEEPLLHALLANDNFKEQFVTTFLDLENVNFDYEIVAEKIDAAGDYVAYPDIWKEFFEKRPEYINSYLAEAFGLTGVLTDVTLSVNDTSGGTMALNTVTPDLSNGSFTGQYYTDYPVTVTALPADGYVFNGWTVDGVSYTDTTLTIPLPDDGASISASFSKK